MGPCCCPILYETRAGSACSFMQFPHCDGMCVIRTLQLRFVFRFEPGPLESRIPIPDLVNHLVRTRTLSPTPRSSDLLLEVEWEG
uniref:Uncharacterized protein n=1 Tax=Physcomitrium patens TaxID=3218 RepID=A0A7I3Z4P6_PHYPA